MGQRPQQRPNKWYRMQKTGGKSNFSVTFENYFHIAENLPLNKVT